MEELTRKANLNGQGPLPKTPPHAQLRATSLAHSGASTALASQISSLPANLPAAVPTRPLPHFIESGSEHEDTEEASTEPRQTPVPLQEIHKHATSLI